MSNPQRWLERLTWPEVAERLQQEGATVVWPFGALEQHGPHLPLSTDALFADRMLDQILAGLAPDAPIWRLPVQAIGFSPEHVGFPGTLSLPSDLLIRLVETVGLQLADLGVRRLVLFNAHGGQIGLLQAAARELRAQTPTMAVLPCFLWSGVPGLKELLPLSEGDSGLHAGLAETSLMLALEPSLVRDQRPVDGEHRHPSAAATPPDGWSLEGAAPFAWLTADLSRTGVVGDSRGASVELGRQLEKTVVDHWQHLFLSLLASAWPPVNSVLSS
ncbi:creatininase family protein [Synechococcus sp. UW105]|uniref:creatininase family protein n=1 Tax=Synechococcus sp. UW105 TaxID=337067 RepID=UPI000E0EB5D2|nr:creatininase family protein [Synechococcus sp. UW105]